MAEHFSNHRPDDHSLREPWSDEREMQVLRFFRRRPRGAEYLACSRCPRDGRLLGAVSRLGDGLWTWEAGARLSPAASRQEIESWYLDAFDETELSADIYEQASRYADEELPRWGRVGSDPTVMRIIVGGLNEPVLTANRHSPDPRPGLPLFRAVTCGCRRRYLLQMLALVYADVGADGGVLSLGTHVPLLRPPRFGERDAIGDSAYSFQGGKVVVNLRDR
jgi:hypothetical protein